MDSTPTLELENPRLTPLYKCGTLTYTRAGLIAIFAWLLWGDFCFTLMESVNSVIQVNLKNLNASDGAMEIILVTLPNILNTTICPWVSFKSDRHRSKRGRRIPFILYTLPFITLSLVLIGCSRDITPWIQHVLPAIRAANPNAVTVVLIGIFCTMFAFFDMFVGSVFYYLFNDVVPPQFLGRFIGLFRLVGTGAGAFYQFFIFKYADTHMREIIGGVAILYFLGMLVVCLKVKEGDYPPPPPNDAQGRRSSISSVIAFFRQSFSARLYVYIFLTSTFTTMGYVTGIYGIFFSCGEMGLTLDQLGKLNGIGMMAALAATYFTAIFVDRWHALRVASYTAITAAVTGMAAWIWIFVTLPGKVYFWLALGGSLVTVFSRVLADAASIPMCMRLFPKSLYGQFSAAQAGLRSAGNIVASFLVIGLMFGLRELCDGSDYVYRFVFLWPWILNCGGAVFYYLAYREWRRLGGDQHYKPPAPWLPEGVEEEAQTVVSVPTRPRLVMLSMWLGLFAAVLSAMLVVVFIFLMERHHLFQAHHWYLWIFMPIKLMLVAITVWQVYAVRNDIRDTARGLTTRLGVPHHGVLLVYAVQGLFYFPIFWLQTIWMIEVDMQEELILFGIANLVAMAMGILGIQIIRWMESPVTTHNPDHAIPQRHPLEPMHVTT